MKDVIKFLLFLAYATIIFFVPNSLILLLFFTINVIIMLFARLSFIATIRNIMGILPFIILTVAINLLLGYYIDALGVAIKLLLVCQVTFIYSQTTTVMRNCQNNRIAMYTFKNISYKPRGDSSFSMYLFIYDTYTKK